MPKLYAKRYTLNASPGFSLIEMLLSVLVILALISILFAAAGTFKHTLRSNNQTLATKIATRQIETLKKNGFDALPSLGSSFVSDSDLAKLPSGQEQQIVSVYPSNCAPSCSNDIRQIKITVSWTEQGGTRNLILETVMSKNGL